MTAEVVDDAGLTLWCVEWGAQPDPTGLMFDPELDELVARTNYGERPIARCVRCKPR